MGAAGDSKLCLKNVYELLGEQFVIPAYQRGYRWTETQVLELLDDIWEFGKTHEGASFYCLQPIVVARDGDGWQVVDGQQRLTTLFLILTYLEHEHLRRSLGEAYKRSLYSIRYETREDCKAFLQGIHTELEPTNIDFFHMVEAYRAICSWFSEKDFNDNNLLLSILLAKSQEDRTVKVIWYDLSDECDGNEYAIDVFSRINIGKIPLTNAELVKALFLQRSHLGGSQAKSKQLRIASEWDAIEQQLQQPSFWHFISKSSVSSNYQTRIEFIFDLMKNKGPNDEPFFTFHKFNLAFKSGQSDTDQLWKEVKEYFLTFDEWFQDRELYHLVGFLVDCGESVANIKAESEKNGITKTEFKRRLNELVRQEVDCQLDELSYGDAKVRKVLLLFNIRTLHGAEEGDARFPFDRYRQESWDIEHIRSQTDIVLVGASRFDWMEDIQSYFRELGVKDEPQFVKEVAQLLIKREVGEDQFGLLFSEVNNYFDKGSPAPDGLGNLALLDARTNRSYKNAVFPIKRGRIIENDKQGVFVPICTKNVFLKYYSQSLTELLYWTESDADDYRSAIASVLKEYLPPQGESFDDE